MSLEGPFHPKGFYDPWVDAKCLTSGLLGHDCFLEGWQILTIILGEKAETSTIFPTVSSTVTLCPM